MTSVPSSELRDRIAAAARTVQLRLGPNATSLAMMGAPISLSGGEADLLTDGILAIVQPELDRLRAERDFWRNRYRQESRTTWDDTLPPGGECCADCGQPVESEPCDEHHPGTIVDRLRVELEQARQQTARATQSPYLCGAPHPDNLYCDLDPDHDHPHAEVSGNQWTP